MSGIFGIIRRDGQPVLADDLQAMRRAMAHRGPDSAGTWLEGPVGLGQLMLRTTPESVHEVLPFRDPESGLVITADARIDRREELSRNLGLHRSEERSGPDLAVEGRFAADAGKALVPDSLYILEAYKRWGDACVDYLEGDFAFAIWNPRERRLFCARDRMGTRPFFYTLDDRQFVFASSALGVVAAPGVPARISELRVADFLVQELEGVDWAGSWFEGVHRMPPAHVGWLSGEGFRVARYWEPDPEAELCLPSDEDYVEAMEEALQAAVDVRLRGTVACMLSGGVDSSTIVALARARCAEPGSGPLPVLSGVSEQDEDCPESRRSRAVADQGGVQAVRFRPSAVASLADRLEEVHVVAEDPFDMLWILHQCLYLRAREEGWRAVMDGIDGDGVASLTWSYPAFLLRAGLIREALRDIRLRQRDAPSPGRAAVADALAMARTAWIPGGLRPRARPLRRHRPDPTLAQSLLSEEAAERMEIGARLREYRRVASSGGESDLRRAHVKRITAPYVTAGIERYGRLAATCGVEQREPLLDARFVSFCIALPWRQKVNGRRTKVALRRLAARHLPAEVAWQTDHARINWKFWRAWGEGQWRQGCREELSALPEPLAGLVDPLRLDRAIQGTNMGDVSASEAVFSLLCLVRWLRRIESTR